MSPAPTPSVRTTSEKVTSRSEGTTPPVVRRNATSAIVRTHVVGNPSMPSESYWQGPAFPQQHKGGVIVGARSRGADRRREGQRAVGATRGVPTGATNSAIAALLKSRYDRARPCSADFDDRSDGRVFPPATYSPHSRAGCPARVGVPIAVRRKGQTRSVGATGRWRR
jgi:hypothetical protein